MLSDQTMEKKSPGRNVSVAPKGSSSEIKLKQDAPNKYHRPNKQKEFHQYPRPDFNKKPQPNVQRWRNYNDRKPRFKMDYDCDGSEVALEQFDLDGNHSRSSKKVRNVNHLINFTMNEPKSSPLDYFPNARRPKLPKYNKEHFLLAQCQFVVNEGGNYSMDTKEIDILVDWDHIEDVVMPTFETVTCPICLYPPTAAKMTRCGHIYCWPCLLQYASLSDKNWRKCPICYESIHTSDLKSVTTCTRANFKVGDTLNLYLMRRPKHSTIAQPVAFWRADIQKPLGLTEEYDLRCFQKILVANKKEVYAILEREKRELEFAKIESMDAPEVCFVDQAMRLLKSRESLLLVHKFADREAEDVIKESLSLPVPSKFFLEDYENGNSVPASPESPPPLDSPTSSHTNQESVNNKDFHYYYQSTDGQCIFLNPLNIQMLVTEFGSLDRCPPMITGEVLDLESNFMNENLRKRLRYLGHLPLTSEFSIAEIKLSSPVLSSETTKQYEKEMKMRKKQRKEKARMERLQEQGKKKKAAVPDLDSFQHFPITSPTTSDFPLGTSPPNSEEHFPSLANVEVPEPTNERGASSFAQMLKEGRGSANFTASNSWPQLGSPPPPSDSGPSFGECVSLALDKIAESNGSETTPGKGKKKKTKKTVLFSTGINFCK